MGSQFPLPSLKLGSVSSQGPFWSVLGPLIITHRSGQNASSLDVSTGLSLDTSTHVSWKHPFLLSKVKDLSLVNEKNLCLESFNPYSGPTGHGPGVVGAHMATPLVIIANLLVYLDLIGIFSHHVVREDHVRISLNQWMMKLNLLYFKFFSLSNYARL